MEYWVILGIEKTADEEVINAAYREKLQYVHPEDHPEEFMRLRAAYEEALKYARRINADAQPAEKTPVELWIDRVSEVYDTLHRRTDPEEWKALMADDVCQGIDSRTDARNALLQYCMECFYMPPAVWQVLDSTFSLQENRSELYELFPREYIDNAVIGGLDGQPTVPYDLFAENTGNPDAYIRLFFKARSECRDGNLDASAATVEDMKNCGIEHPYTRLAEAELASARGEKEQAWSIVSALAEQYPGDIGIRLASGDLNRFYKEDFEAALADYNAVVSVMPEHNPALWGKAECLLALEQLEEAKEIYLRLNQKLPYDDDVAERINRINNMLVERYERQLGEEPENIGVRMDYAWSCMQRREYDKAKALLADARPTTLEDRCDYENISSKLSINMEDAEEALRHARIWEELVPQLPEGETEEEKIRKGKMPQILYLQAVALFMLDRCDEAIEKADASQAADPESTDPYDVRRRVHLKRREFEKAVKESEKVVEMEPSYVNWYSLAYDQYALGDKVAAYHSFGEALGYARVLQAYIFRTRILCDLDEWDAVKEAVEYLEENGVESEHDCIRYLKARLARQNGDPDTALSEYKALIERIEAGESPLDFPWEVYREAADIEDDKGCEPEYALRLVDKGLEAKDDYLPLLDLKSYLLWNARRYDEYMELNRTILKLYPNHRVANERVGDVLYDEKHDYEGALEHYLRQEPLRDSAVLQEVIGLCYMYLERYEEAEPRFRRAIEMESDRLRPRSNLGLMSERQFDFEKSLPFQQECVRINLEKELGDKRCYRWLARVLARLRRYDEAAEAYRKNYELYGEEEDARHVVEVYMESGDFARAEKLLEKYHSEGICDEPYLRMLADIRKLRGKRYLHITKKIKNESEASLRLADYYFSRKQYEKALEYFKKLDSVDPGRAERDTNYISCLYELGRREELEKLTERALKYCRSTENCGWMYAMHLTHKAYVLMAVRRMDEAKELIDRAMTAPLCDHCRYSKCKDAYIALGRYHRIQGEHEKALELYREAYTIAPDDLDIADDIKETEKEIRKK